MPNHKHPQDTHTHELSNTQSFGVGVHRILLVYLQDETVHMQNYTLNQINVEWIFIKKKNANEKSNNIYH